MITQEEMEKRIAEARQKQMMADFGKAWFIEALTHTGGMVQRGEFPAEAHQVGQMCYQQLMGVPAEGGEKAKEKDATTEV